MEGLGLLLFFAALLFITWLFGFSLGLFIIFDLTVLLPSIHYFFYTKKLIPRLLIVIEFIIYTVIIYQWAYLSGKVNENYGNKWYLFISFIIIFIICVSIYDERKKNDENSYFFVIYFPLFIISFSPVFFYSQIDSHFNIFDNLFSREISLSTIVYLTLIPAGLGAIVAGLSYILKKFISLLLKYVLKLLKKIKNKITYRTSGNKTKTVQQSPDIILEEIQHQDLLINKRKFKFKFPTWLNFILFSFIIVCVFFIFSKQNIFVFIKNKILFPHFEATHYLFDR